MRYLPNNFETLLQGAKRNPAYRVLAFDPALDSMSDVVTGSYLQTPLDLTPYCSKISWSPDRFGFTLEDRDAQFHPDFGAKRNYLVNGAILRLQEGDVALETTEWINSFTGQVQGQIGWRKSRRSQALEATVLVYSRENTQSWKRRSITTKQYTAGTEIGVMLHDLCIGLMGMSPGEIRIPSTLGVQLKHHLNQLVQVSPWGGITAILETVGSVPFFDGDGRLACYSKSLTTTETRLFSDWKKVVDYIIPEFSQEAINQIRVIFLDSNLEEVPGSDQLLGTAQATAGFFIPKIELDCWWSEDHKQRARNTRMVIKQSVITKVGRMASVGNFGMEWATEEYEIIDDFHGRVVITVPWYTPALFAAALLQYLAAAAMGDMVVSFGAGWTVPVGRIMEALALIQILGMMMCIGTGQYEIWGIPYDYAYIEKQSIAAECNLEYWQLNERIIKNDFLGTQEQADAIALLELIWEHSRCFPRKLVIKDDPKLELGDLIRLPDGIKFFITGMSKSLGRGDVPLLTLDGFKVRGVL
jgi:hypothetical protein